MILLPGTSALRVMRILRLIRLIGRLERLNTLVEAFLFSMQSVMWVGFLMVLFLYIFGVMAANLFGQDEDLMASLEEQDASDYRLWFSSVPRSMATLLQVITMDSWSSQIARPIGQYSPLAWLFLAFIMIMIGMGFLNLMAAIFVDSLLEMNKNGAVAERKAKQAAQERAMEMISELYCMIDEDGSGTIGKDELEEALAKLEGPGWKPVLEGLGLSVDSMQVALSNVSWETDEDGEDVLFYEDFLSMFVSLDEPATKKMVYHAEKGISKCIRDINQLEQDTYQRFDAVNEKLAQLISILNK